MADVSYPSFDSPFLSQAQRDAVAQVLARRPTPQRVAPPPPPPPENGVFTDVGHGLAGGLMVDLPTMAGQALKAFSPRDSSAYQAGQDWQDAAKQRGEEEQYRTTGAFGAGARSVGSLAPILALNAVPGVGSALSLGAAGALFGGSGYQGTKEAALAAGAGEDTATSAGLKEGALQGIGQTIGAYAGGKLVTGLGNVMLQKVLGRAGIEGAFKEIADPTTHIVRNTAEALGVNLPLQAGIAAGSAAIERGAGIDSDTPWEAAKASFGPTAAMTALLAPIGVFGARGRANQLRNDGAAVRGVDDKGITILDPNATEEQKNDVAEVRKRAMVRTYRYLKQFDAEAAKNWVGQAELAIFRHEEVKLDVDFNADAARAEKRARDQQAAAEQAPVTPINGPEPLALPAPAPISMGEGMPPESPDVAAADAHAKSVQDARDAEDERQRQLRVNEPIPEKGGRGAQPSEDEVSARLLAAKNEEAPGQGTARLLGLPVDSAVQPAPDILGVKAMTEGDTKQKRVQILRKLGLGDLRGTSRDDLIAVNDPKDVPDALRKIWYEKGGEKAEAGYVKRIGELYKQLTGREIDEVKSYEEPTRNKSGEAAAEDNTGAKSEPAAVQAGAEAPRSAEQMDEAKGDGSTVAGEQDRVAAKESGAEGLTGDVNALQEQSPSREVSHDAEAGKDQPGGGEGVRQRESGQEAAGKARAGGGEAEVVGYQKELQATIDKTKAMITGKQARLDQLLTIAKQTKEQYATMKRLETEIGQHNAELKALVDENSKAVGDVEALKSGVEPTRDTGHYDDLKRGVDPNEGLTQVGRQNLKGEMVGDDAHTGNAIRLHKYLEALVLSGRANAAEKALFGSLGGFRPGAKSRSAAQIALDAMPAHIKAQYDKLAGRYQHLIDVTRTMIATAKEKEDAAARSAGEHVMNEAEFNERFEQIAKDRADGKIDAKTQYEREIELMNDHWKLHGRDLVGVEASSMVAQLALDNSTQGMLDHLAATHPNPIMRAVASLLKATGVNPKIVRPEMPDFNGGRYVARTNTIEIGRGGMNPVTMFHEIWHAATQNAINRAQVTLTQLAYGARTEANLSPRERKEIEALRTVREVMNKFREVADLNDPEHVYALKDVHEFLSEANSNPSIQAVLGGARNWLQRIRQKFADTFGFSKDHQTDFEKLLRASTDLFGDPRTTLSDRVFNRPFGEDDKVDMSHPYEAARLANHAFNQLGGVGEKLNRLWQGDWKQNFDKQLLSYTTLNHHEQMLTRIARVMRETFKNMPEVQKALDQLEPYIKAWRRASQDGKAAVNTMTSGENELNQHNQDLLDYDSKHPKEAARQHQVLRDSTKSGIPAWARTLDEAQKGDPSDPLKRGNPDATQKMFDHEVAQQARENWKKLSPEAQQLALKQFAANRMLHTRDAMTHLRQFMYHYDLSKVMAKEYGNLHWSVNRLDEKGDVRSHLDQETANMQSMKTTLAAIDKIADDANHPSQSDADAVRTNAGAFMKNWYQEHNKPYVHLGRQGPHYIKLTVAGGQAEWDRVGQAVSQLGPNKEGRDWNVEPLNDKRNVMMRFANKWDHKQAMKALEPLKNEGLFKNEEGEAAWEAGTLEDKQRSLTGATPKFIRDLVSRMEKNPNMTPDQKENNRRTIYDSWLQMMPETSPLKSRMSSDSTSGSMMDTTQASIERQSAHIQSIAGIERAMGFTEALIGLHKAREALNKVNNSTLDPYNNKISLLLDELNSRAAELQKIEGYNPIVNQVKSITAVWDLALSPAYMLMVGYQPWQISVPEIAKKYGYGSTMLSMAKNTAKAWQVIAAASKMGWGSSQADSAFDKLSQISDVSIHTNQLAKNGLALDAHQSRMINDLLGSGLVNMGMAKQLYRLAPENRSVMDKAMRIAQLLPHAIEVSNRIATALTAHEMARTKGKMEHEQASEYALETIRNTDGDHSQANIARKLGQRGVLKQYTPLFVGFGQYDLQMTEFLGRTVHAMLSKDSTKAEKIESAKALGMIALHTSVIAGTLGLPFAGIATGLWNAAKQILQDEGETPPDAAYSWAQLMKSMFGEKGGEIVSHGAPRALGFDMSGRSGYQDLFPFTNFLADRAKMEDRFANGMTAFMGPSMGIVSGLAIGAQESYHGNYPKAINNALPAFMRNIAKAYRLDKYGEEAVSGANAQIPLPPPSSWDVVMRGAGFTSSPKAEYTEANFAWRQEQEILQARHQVIMNEMLRAASRNDGPALELAFQRAIKFATAQPQFRNFDLAGSLRQQSMGQAVGAMPGMHGVMVKKGQLPYYQQFTNGSLPTYQ